MFADLAAIEVVSEVVSAPARLTAGCDEDAPGIVDA
jgi:hypothetical protein